MKKKRTMRVLALLSACFLLIFSAMAADSNPIISRTDPTSIYWVADSSGNLAYGASYVSSSYGSGETVFNAYPTMVTISGEYGYTVTDPSSADYGHSFGNSFSLANAAYSVSAGAGVLSKHLGLSIESDRTGSTHSANGVYEYTERLYFN
ncbi:MAG: hypothetical protein VB111_12970 [Clostridiaceae bacterium]|nr:hypothetical protein [Clostridiaceae bacterium]